MTKLAYLDCPTGIAGDMCLGALIDAGVPLDYLATQLDRLGMTGEYQLVARLVHRNGQQATKVEVELIGQASPGGQPSRSTANRTQGADSDTDPAQPSQPIEDRPPYHHNEAAGDAPTDPRHDGMHTHAHHAHSHAHTQSHSHAGSQTHGQAHSHAHSHAHSDTHSHVHDLPSEHPHPSHHGIHPDPNAVTVPGRATHSHGTATRHLPEIEQMIQGAGLPDRVTAWSLAVFRQLAVAEGAVHGIPADQVHFHEVGAVDAIVDIVGTCLGLDWLGIEALYCSALPTGGGTVRAAHGRLPVPVPAVLKLLQLRPVPIYHNGIDRELVTPTGAAIATTLAQQFGPPPAMTLEKIGLGAGSIDLTLPNILRLWIGTSADSISPSPRHSRAEPGVSHPSTPLVGRVGAAEPLTAKSSLAKPDALRPQTVSILETQIDDLNPQAIGYVLEELLTAGALDVFTQAIGMKKSRPGILLTVVCLPETVPICEAILFRETTTLGIRHSTQQRTILNRAIQTVQTAYGAVRVKVAWRGDRSPTTMINIQPEYEDCAHIARQHHLPWRTVHQMALQTWYTEQSR
jgi:pyridinium-3,5-bisthiocarboxylic acid mononucleotide nickel chelatase